MRYTTLGRTGLRTSIMGLGGGGPSRLGRKTGSGEDDSASIVREAVASGVNLIDTAESYDTEMVIGRAIEDLDRESIIISTKKFTLRPFGIDEVGRSLGASLKRLGTDYVDIYHLHAVTPGSYDELVEEVYPVLENLRDEGTIRHIGITEHFNRDPGHTMLRRAVGDGLWDVMMVGFNILNQSARDVLEEAGRRGIGTLVMFAVRRALWDTSKLREVLEELISRGEVDSPDVDLDDPLGFLIREGGAASLPDAAYRFCRDEPGVDVVLSGTGNPVHLRENIASFSRPPLPEAHVERLRHIFRRSTSVTGQ